MNIQRRIALVAAIFVVLVSAMAVLTQAVSTSASESIEQVIVHEAEPTIELQKVELSLRSVQSRLLGSVVGIYPFAGSRLALAEMRDEIARHWSRIRAVRFSAEIEAQKMALDRDLPLLWRFLDAADEAAANDDASELRRLLEDEWPLIHTHIIRPARSLVAAVDDHAHRRYRQVMGDAERRERWALAMAGGMLLLVVSTVLWLLRRLSRGIGAIHGGLERLSPNRSWADVRVRGDDEFSQMAKKLNETAWAWQFDRARMLELTARNKLILDSIGDGVYGTDASGHFAFINPAGAALLGWSAEELAGRPVHETIHHHHADGRDYPTADCPLYRTYADGRVHSADDEVFWRRDGGAVEVEVLSTPIVDGREIRGAVVTFRDIGERKRAAAELRRYVEELQSLNRKLEEAQNQLLQSEKMASIGQLAAGVAHEINNPVGFVNSNLGTLKQYSQQLLELIATYQAAESNIGNAGIREELDRLKQVLDLEFLKEDLPNLIKESEEGLVRVMKIVQDLKDFSHVNESEWQFADLNAGLDSTLNVVWNEVKHKATVDKHFGEIPKVECLAAQLNQVFMNLIVNAVQALDGSRGLGKLTLSTGCAGDEVWVDIEDNGCGIDAELQKRIFEPFFTTKPVGKGTGLGLSLSYNIVQKHRGRIELHSEPGVGSRFRVWIPIRRDGSASPKEVS